MADVIKFNGITKLDLSPDHVLEEAKGNLQSVVIMGYDNEGEEYFASSISDGAEVVWLAELFKRRLFEQAELLADIE